MKAGANWNSVSGCVSRSFDSPCDTRNNQNDDALRSTQSLPHNKKGAINMGLVIRRALTASAATLLEMTEFASPQQANTDSQPWRSPVPKECPVKYVKKPYSTVSCDDSGSTGKSSSRRIRASSVVEVGGRMMRMRKKSGQSDKSQTQKCGSSGEKSRQDKKSKQYEQVMNVAAAEHFQHQAKNKVHVGRHRSATLASAASITLQKSLSRELQSSQDSIDQMGSEDEDVLPLSMGIGKGHNRANTRDTCTRPNGPNIAAGKVSELGFRRFLVIRDESRSNLFDSDSELSTCTILANSVSSNNGKEQYRPNIAQKLDQNTPTYRASPNKNVMTPPRILVVTKISCIASVRIFTPEEDKEARCVVDAQIDD
ncbi:hypothetical protein SARC_06730 [Sphaeroforma arctica JP610]|uniref:Uncharacterized protein n=1 Tax=Sphaeroforma arctica JP610 TaxID=667725 RepID=A0A0L0FVQ5_9EUKA|nr:hypothetical protein SARC_06730 [Sphaeroforma arctica JP610]KNC80922.1 hypothetical protein SARC_06730 [Sphaeroforma arctica JP610]|eukprot:XP_014154824.1 hypothetical protein SARC_06730 [Sphaeroforma arctica JP610]